MSHIEDAGTVRRKLALHAPELGAGAVERLVEMYSQARLPGIGAAEPLPVEPEVRISIRQGAGLYRLAKESGARSALEVGFAYGFSTIWLLAALAQNGGAHHIAIDPWEADRWHGIGLKQVELLDSGVPFEWMADPSMLALPELVRRRHEVDLVFIDSRHIFDETLAEFFLADKLLKVGGLMLFDDQWMPAMRSVSSFVLRNRAYERVRHPVQNLCVLRKTGEDTRAWNHFAPFSTSESLPLAFVNRLRRALSSW